MFFSRPGTIQSYLIVTPQLRDDKLNSLYYPFEKETSNDKNLDHENFQNSLYFAGFSLFTSLSTGILAYW